MKPIAVICPYLKDFIRWCKDNPDKAGKFINMSRREGAFFVNRDEKLMGMEISAVVETGQYWLMSDYDKIKEVALSRIR